MTEWNSLTFHPVHMAGELRWSAYLGWYEGLVNRALAELAAKHIMSRIWQHDHTVWKPEPTEISNRLGWLHLPDVMRGEICRLEGLRESLCAAGYTHALLLGMGGSSLAPELFQKTFAAEGSGALSRPSLQLAVLDSTHPDAVWACAERLDPRKTVFLVSTKSGTTVETLSLFKFCYTRVAEGLGTTEAGEHFMAITDPGSPLIALAEHCGFRQAILSDPNIGGRYSALSHFGLVPAALVGVDLPRLLDRAACMASACGASVDVEDNPAAQLGAILGTLAQHGRDKATFILSPPIVSFGDWVEQLLAESTGKEGRGILPIVGEPLGGPAVYGDDRLFVHLRLDGDDTHDKALQALAEAGHPVIRLHLRDPYDVGGQFFLWEMATAVAGHVLSINPFDQPNVEAAKKLARQMITQYMAQGRLPSETPALIEAGIQAYGDEVVGDIGKTLAAFLSQAEAGAYVALQAYVPPTAETDAALLALRIRVRERCRLATTVGYGPRFLHSTGQLHKGDAGRGLFIQLTADPSRDVGIPDEAGEPASSVTFGVLIAAQAWGDRQALLRAGRRVLRFHLGTDVLGGLTRLKEAIP